MLGTLVAVKPATWFVNAGLRTLRAFVPSLARPDDTFAAQWLSGHELDLYQGMDRRDRDHACRVARALLAAHPGAPATVVRAALLHDVGKSAVPYRAWERIVVHLCRPWREARGEAAGRDDTGDAGATPAVGLVGLLAWHRRHAARGAEMILAAGGDPEVAALVRHHHDPRGFAGAELIRAADADT